MHTIPFLWQCFRIGLEVALEKGIEIPYLSVFCEHSTIYISDTFHEIFRAVYSLKFHETLKGRWLSTRNILVTARLILAGDFWLMIQKKTRQNRECDDDFIGLRLRRARLPKLNCLCQRFSKWSSSTITNNFALALKPTILHLCGFSNAV